jgi:predicted oxidoreductase
MKTMPLGASSLQVTRIAQGCMRLSNDPAEARATARAALEQGITFFDHADVYGAGSKEAVFSGIWAERPHLRQQIVLQSKCGIRPKGETGPYACTRYDFSYSHILEAVEGSLRRLKTDYLDVLLLHRPDALVEPEEVAAAFARLYREGKVRWFGVSNHTAGQMALLKRYVEQPLVANQIQVSVAHTQLFDEGIWMNREDAPTPAGAASTLEYCRLHDITVQAWSPLEGGFLCGRPLAKPDARIERAAAAIAQMAADKGVSPEAIAIAWVLHHPARIQAIIGTTNPARIAAACQADSLELTREEWYWLLEAGHAGQRVP